LGRDRQITTCSALGAVLTIYLQMALDRDLAKSVPARPRKDGK